MLRKFFTPARPWTDAGASALPARRDRIWCRRQRSRARAFSARPAPRRCSPTGANGRQMRETVPRTSCRPRPPRPDAIEFRINGRGRTEEHQRLIDQVAAEIVEQPAGLGGRGLAPRAPWLRSPTFEPRLEAVNVAKRFLGEEPSNREKVAVPAAVVKNREQHAAFVGRLDQGWASPAVGANGLSTTVARPAAIAADASGTCVRLGDAITTTSTPR